MGGGLMQLVAYGAQDIYLTGNPQITFFKVVYRRHTNFSMETISQTLDGNATIGSTNNQATCTISRNGDLIHKMYITTISPGIIHGSKIISSVELEIGGQKIDKHTEEWNNIWNELSTPESKVGGLKSMQGDDGGKSGDDTGLKMIQVPLNFWFCRNPGLALPLIALQYHEVKINFVFGKSEDVSHGATNINLKFYVDYIYLDTDERRRFAQVSHEYLIEQVQMQSMESDISNELTFNHPVKELIWTTPYNKKNNYGTAILKLNGHDRFEKQEEEYFQLRQPFDHHTTVPRANLTIHNHMPRVLVSNNLLVPAAVTLTSGTTAATAITSGNFMIANGNNETGVGSFESSNEPIYCFNKYDIDETNANLIAYDYLLFIGSGKNFGPHEDKNVNSVESELLSRNPHDVLTIAEASINLNSLYLQLGTEIYHTKADSQLTEIGHGNSGMIEITAIHQITQSHCSHEAYTSKLSKKINVYSFALKPEEHQPSGTCNFSRIDTAILEFSKSPTGANNIYAVNYNVLRIMSGMGGLAYSN